MSFAVNLLLHAYGSNALISLKCMNPIIVRSAAEKVKGKTAASPMGI
jgi:hypothetical protein